VSGSFSDLPKYPGESEDDRAKLLGVLRSDAPAEPEPFRDRVRHMLPALTLIAGLAFAGFIALGMAITILTKAVDAGVVGPLALIAAFLALPAVAIGAAVYQRHRNRQRRGWS